MVEYRLRQTVAAMVPGSFTTSTVRLPDADYALTVGRVPAGTYYVLVGSVNGAMMLEDLSADGVIAAFRNLFGNQAAGVREVRQ